MSRPCSSRCTTRWSARTVASRSFELTPERASATADSTVPTRFRLARPPRGVKCSTARRRTSGWATRRSSPCVSSRRSTPVSVLACTWRMPASSPADIPGKRPTTRSTSRCGPVIPSSRFIRLDVRSRPWATAQSSSRNRRTSGICASGNRAVFAMALKRRIPMSCHVYQTKRGAGGLNAPCALRQTFLPTRGRSRAAVWSIGSRGLRECRTPN